MATQQAPVTQTNKTPSRLYDGAAWGCDGRAIRTQFTFTVPQDMSFDAIDAAFEQVFKTEPSVAALEAKSALEGFVQRVLHWNWVLQHLNKIPVSQDVQILSQPQAGRPTDVALSSLHPQVSKIVLTALTKSVKALTAKPVSKADAESHFQTLQEEMSKALKPFAEPGQNRVHLIKIANARRIPVNLTLRQYPIFGQGPGAIRLRSSVTGRETSIGMTIARDKFDTAHVLRQAGLPGAQNAMVKNEEELLAAEKRWGFPLVVKARDLDGGKGVYADIRSRATLLWAYKETLKHSKNIMIERHFEGAAHRLTFCEGKLLVIMRKQPAGIFGDGTLTIEELIEAERQTRERERTAVTDYRAPLELDEEALGILAEAEMTAQTILADGQFLALRRRGNTVAGGKNIVLTEAEAHPDNIMLCKEAAECLGLKTAGVDLLIPDISVSWAQSGALICEVNGMPQFPFMVAERFMDTLFEDYQAPKITVVLTERPEKVDLVTLSKRQDFSSETCFVTIDHILDNGVRKPRQFERYFDAARAALCLGGYASLVCILSLDEFVATGLPAHKVERIFCVTQKDRKLSQKMQHALQMSRAHCDTIKGMAL